MRDSLPRRRRLGDPFASPSKIEQLLEQFINLMSGELAPYINLENARRKNYEPLVQLLQRASNFLRTGGDTSTPALKQNRFPKTLLARVIETMNQILNRESQGRISFRTFTDNN